MFCVPAASQQHILPARRHSCPSSVLFWRRQSGTSCHGAEPAAWLHHAHSKQRTPNLSWLFLILAWDVGDSFCVMWWDEITLFFGGGPTVTTKPQKVGGCGWSRCPPNHILSHVAKDMAYSWFVAVSIWSFWGPFWAISGTYHGVRGLQRAR